MYSLFIEQKPEIDRCSFLKSQDSSDPCRVLRPEPSGSWHKGLASSGHNNIEYRNHQ